MINSSLADLVSHIRNRRGWLLPLSDERGNTFANNGDLLMHHVFHDICTDLGISLSDEPNGAEFVAVPPNGALLDRFQAPDIVRQRLRPHADKPLVIFPSSAQFITRDPSEMFEGRSAPTLWILREPYSFRHLDERWGSELEAAGVTLALDHDVVISGARHVPGYFPMLKSTKREHHALLVARLGVEAKDIRNDEGPKDTHGDRAGSAVKQGLVALSRSLPASIIRPARRLSTRSRIRVASANLLATVPPAVQQQFDRASINAATDISDPSLTGFDEYCARIGRAETVLTNRLHVAIPAALLGKDTYLVDSGYHKLRGIYEHSLQHLDNITFVARS